MGVSLWYVIKPRGKRRSLRKDIDVGWRSMMYSLLNENGLIRRLTSSDLMAMRDVAEYQERGNREPPFDWADDIFLAFAKMASDIEEYGEIEVMAAW